MTTTVPLRFLSAALLCLAACGNVQNDGGEPDAAPSGDQPDAAPPGPGEPDAMMTDPDKPGPVDVQVLSLDNDGKPHVGANVIFMTATGALVSNATTETAGTATATMAPGGSVTVVVHHASRGTRIVTVLDVRPGDKLVFGTDKFQSTTTRPALLASVVPLTSTDGISYSVHARCRAFGVSTTGGGTPRTATLPFTSGCDDDSAIDFVAMARNGTNSNVWTAVLEKQPRAVAPKIVEFDSQWRPTNPMSVSLTNVPAGTARMQVHRLLRRGRVPFFDSLGFASEPIGAALTVSLPGGSLQVGDDMQLQTYLQGTPIFTSQFLYDVRPVGASYGLDLGAALLPTIQPAAFDVAGGMSTWSLRGNPAPIDAIVVTSNYTRGAGAANQYEWRVIAPSSTGSFHFPDLPESVGPVEPQAGDTGYVREGVMIEVDGKTYRDLVNRLDLESDRQLDDDQVAPRVRVSRFDCGTRACGS